MIAISFRFLAGRYHATPWGRHVNEGAVEWPPSPWRILRALVATWKRTLPELRQEQVEPVLRSLVEPPEMILPPASTGHTRHYMPTKSSRTMVFDTFVAVSPDERLIVRWRDAWLGTAERTTLTRILDNLNTLGRSESWCEATLPDDDEVLRRVERGRQRISAPLDANQPPDGAEIVRVLCPDPHDAFADEHVVTIKTKTLGRGKNRQKIEQRSSIYDPAWNLCMETLQLNQERWSDPPGSRWVQYTRPRDCFKIEAGPRPRRRPRSAIQVVRYALDSTVLPLVTETLPFAEGARRALMSLHGKASEKGGVRGRSSILSGKDVQGRPLTGHRHAYYLPTDEDGDGRLDHLTVYAADGFGTDERRAFDWLRDIRTGRKDEARHPVRVLLIGMGTVDDYRPGPLHMSRKWVSATPYIATRHAKTRGRNRIDWASPEARAGFLMDDLRRQIANVRPDISPEDISSLTIESEWDGNEVFRVGNRWRTIQFKRRRHRTNDDGNKRFAGAFRLTFDVEIPGPIALGWSSHFGMGMFVPCELRAD